MKQTQGRFLIDRLKAKPHTYLDMLLYRNSISPWKRIAECLRADERLVKGKRGELVTWRVVKVG